MVTDGGAAVVPPIGVSHPAVGVTDVDRALERSRPCRLRGSGTSYVQ